MPSTGSITLKTANLPCAARWSTPTTGACVILIPNKTMKSFYRAAVSGWRRSRHGCPYFSWTRQRRGGVERRHKKLLSFLSGNSIKSEPITCAVCRCQPIYTCQGQRLFAPGVSFCAFVGLSRCSPLVSTTNCSTLGLNSCFNQWLPKSRLLYFSEVHGINEGRFVSYLHFGFPDLA